MRSVAKLNKKLNQLYSGKVIATERKDSIILNGNLDKYSDIVNAGFLAVKKNKHVVNDIELNSNHSNKIRIPSIQDKTLDNKHVDVLIIGGGISGTSIFRELTKWKISVLLVDKECDIANQSSGRNDGEIHPGVDLKKGLLKQKYVVKGNRMYDQLCKDLNVPFKRIGQYAGFTQWYLYPILKLFALQRKYICKIDDTRIVGRKFIQEHAPGLSKDFKFALYNPMAGVVSPYELAIAYAENGVSNGGEVALNTYVSSMEVVDKKIIKVTTNRGDIYPTIVINAAGVFADYIASMVNDRYFSIHPRKGTDIILDKSAKYICNTIASFKKLELKTHTKGGGTIRTVHDNILLGPNAKEVIEREDYSTDKQSIKEVMDKQMKTAPQLSYNQIITYFSGIRPCTYEEDFIIERGHNCKNIIHVAGIQSPGLTTAPAVALDVEKITINLLKECKVIEKNTNFNPARKVTPSLNKLDEKTRDLFIKKNPDYGEIVCRCEEVSKGEIIDCLNRNIKVATLDGIKRRIRPGMGRCQGGFCSPLIINIIADHEHISPLEVKKSTSKAIINYSFTKGDNHE